MKRLIYILILFMALPFSEVNAQQLDKRDVRKGNRDFRKENYRESEIDYMKALVKDSTSIAANYNIANAYYRQGNMEQAAKTLDRVKEAAPASVSAADYHFNRGDVALAMKDYQTAVSAFEQSLILRPDDLDAKENYIYAKKMLQNQQDNQDQNQDNQDNQDQNQDNQDQNQDNQDQNQDNQDNQDQNQDNQDQGDQNQDQEKPQQQQGQQPKISPQAAQQMLQAIQAKEKETQDKVKEQKAKALKARQKDKNW